MSKLAYLVMSCSREYNLSTIRTEVVNLSWVDSVLGLFIKGEDEGMAVRKTIIAHQY